MSENILVTGSKGQLGSELHFISSSFLNFNFFFKDIDLDISNYTALESFIYNNDINIIINAAAYTNVAKSEEEKEKAMLINSSSIKNLVEISEKNKCKLIHISTDYVYNGSNLNPISENAKTNPINFYGLSKRNGEVYIENSNSESIIIRTSWLYSAFGNNFVNTIINKIKNSYKVIDVVNDQFGCPTYAKDLAMDIMKIIESNKKLDFDGKIYNYSNLGYTNWSGLAKKIVKNFGEKCIINEVSSSFFNSKVKRPKFTVTDKNKIIKNFNLDICYWDQSLKSYIYNNFK